MQIPGYKIIRKLNTGGMASVYLAIQLSVGRTVALKIMKPELDQDPDFHKRFEREAAIVGQLSHPNIIPIYDIGNHKGLNYISMEYLPDGSLDEKISTGLQLHTIVDVIIAIASALEHAHAKGYAHRDIKPENILFRADGSAVLTDFGIAKIIKSDVGVTQAGSVIGTPYYMSPEQTRGEPSDGRADLYSLGILFYELLTGARPFQHQDPLALAIQHINEEPPKLPVQFFMYQDIIDRLLAKNPDARFQYARALIAELEIIKRSAANTFPHQEHKTNSMRLFKAIGHAIANDFRHYKNKWINKITSKHRRQMTENLQSSLETTPESANAKTVIANKMVIAAPAKNIRFKYLALSIGFVVIGLFIFGYHIRGNKPVSILPFNQQYSADTKANTLPLTISAAPATSVIRILNIKEKYFPGMQLPAGPYHIEISAPGYQTRTEWIKLTQDNPALNFSLADLASAAKSNTPDHMLPDMIEITAHKFLMGDPSLHADSVQKIVFLASNFYISKYEITFNEYDDFALATNRNLPDDNGWGRGNRPVINVNLEDAKAYAEWLTQITGKHYRLPTAIEWEFAARANTSSAYWWGDTEKNAGQYAHCRFGCRSFFSSLLFNKTKPVGMFPPNNFGLHDTAGNVAEWVEDCYDDNPTAKEQCQLHIIRGGSFRDNVKNITSYAQRYLAAEEANDSTGFRILREIENEPKAEKEPRKEQRKNIFQRFLQRLRQ